MVGAVICGVTISSIVVAVSTIIICVAHQVQIILFCSGIGGQDGGNVSRNRTTAATSEVLRSNQHYIKIILRQYKQINNNRENVL